MKTTPSVALVYDWVTTEHGGAEKVLQALQQAFPDAPLLTSVYDSQQASWAKTFTVLPSFLQNIPGSQRWYRYFLALLPLSFETLSLSDYNIVISVTSFAAKGVLTSPHQLHVCYLLTPPRYLYSHTVTYWSGWLNLPIIKQLAHRVISYLKRWDQVASYRPDKMIPISQRVAERAQQYYQRSIDTIIYPPVTVLPEIKTSPEILISLPEDYYLVVSRLVAYKRIDVAIKACQELGKNLVIVGEGPEKAKLKKLVNSRPDSQIIFLDAQPVDVVPSLLHHCEALLMPGVEDFGIVAVEAAVAGKPVILHAESGAAEILVPLKGCITLETETVASLKKAIHELEKSDFNAASVQQAVQKYVTTRFVSQFQQTVLQYWNSFQRGKGQYEPQ